MSQLVIPFLSLILMLPYSVSSACRGLPMRLLSGVCPDLIYVKLFEREPSARWQHAGKTSVIDHEGQELPQAKLEDLPLCPW